MYCGLLSKKLSEAAIGNCLCGIEWSRDRWRHDLERSRLWPQYA